MWYMFIINLSTNRVITMTKHYLYSTFSHFDNGEINVLSSGINELYALQSAFNLAAGTELSDENYDKATDIICGSNDVEALRKFEINYDVRSYRRVIKLVGSKEITLDQYNTMTELNENKDGWAF